MNDKLLLQDLAELLATRSGRSRKQAESFLRAFFELVEQGLVSDNFVKIKGLGTFKLVTVEKRESVNVNTGERIEIDEHTKVSFVPDASMKDYINKPFAHFQTVIINEGTDIELMENVNVDESVENYEAEEHIGIGSLNNDCLVEETVNSISSEKEKDESYQERERLSEDLIQECPNELIQDSEEDGAIQETAEIKEESFAESEEDNNHATTGSIQATSEAEPKNEPRLKNESASLSEEHKNKDVNWWKMAVLLIGILFLMILSYFAGYFRLLCPCEYMQEVQQRYGLMTHDEKRPAVITTTLPVDNDRKTIVRQTTSVEKSAESDVEVKSKIDKTEVPTHLPKKVELQEKEKAPVAKESESESLYLKATNYSQISGAKYLIVGTKKTYTIQRGETLYQIASREYGSDGYAKYIVTYNRITDPDAICFGTTIKLPLLLEKK